MRPLLASNDKCTYIDTQIVYMPGEGSYLPRTKKKTINSLLVGWFSYISTYVKDVSPTASWDS